MKNSEAICKPSQKEYFGFSMNYAQLTAYFDSVKKKKFVKAQNEVSVK